MKKLMCLMIAIVVCLSMTLSVSAAGDAFVPSISEKDGPQLVTNKDKDGNLVYARILDANGEELESVDEDCLVITPVSKANNSSEIPSAAKQMLLSVYEQLNNGSMKIPYEKFGADLDADKMVVRELIDISWPCDEHSDMMEEAGTTVELTFDLGVKADVNVYVMSYKNNEWKPIVKTVNNGDGTVTCTFAGFCPIAFSVVKGIEAPPSQTGDDADLTLWITLMAVSVAGLAAVFFVYRKNAKKAAK